MRSPEAAMPFHALAEQALFRCRERTVNSAPPQASCLSPRTKASILGLSCLTTLFSINPTLSLPSHQSRRQEPDTLPSLPIPMSYPLAIQIHRSTNKVAAPSRDVESALSIDVIVPLYSVAYTPLQCCARLIQMPCVMPFRPSKGP